MWACQASLGLPQKDSYLFRIQRFMTEELDLAFSASKCYNFPVEWTFISGLTCIVLSVDRGVDFGGGNVYHGSELAMSA